jgi:biotin carboxylase
MSTEAKRLLILASKLGYQTRNFAEAAMKLGVEVRFATDRCHRLEDPWGDRAIAVHFERPEEAAGAILETMREEHIDAVLALGDQPTVAAAYVARRLGLEGNHPLAVAACRSKLRQREVLAAAGLRVPWFRALPLWPVPEPALSVVTFPCVVKPLRLSASQGVIRANNREEFCAAIERIARLLESPEVQVTRGPELDQVIAEGYIAGHEVAIEGLLSEGRLRMLAIFDKPDRLEGPFFEETIYVTPSRLTDEQQREIEQCAEAAVRALGLTHGPVHAEFRINEQGVWPVEVAPRPIGGLCSRALRFGLNENTGMIFLEELLVRHALGLPGADWPRESAASGVMMIPVPRSGVLEKVEGEEEALAVPGITELHITARLHDTITAWPEGSSYLGFLFARGGRPEEVEHALRKAHAKLRFTITAPLPVAHATTGRMRGN